MLKVLALAGIIVCFLELICGVTSAGLIGSAKSYATSYNNSPLENYGLIDFYYNGEFYAPINYTLFVGITVAIISFFRLLLHGYYLRVPVPPRVVAIADLAVVSVWFVFILTGVALLPRRLDLFGDYTDIEYPYTDWVMKLKRAWVFVLLSFLLWLVTLVLAAFMLTKSAAMANTMASPPTPNEVKNVQMGGPGAQNHAASMPAPV